MQVVSIQTPDDPFYKYSANFNPSILQLDDGRYLLAFRSFRRLSIQESQEYGVSVNHPWLGGPEDVNWWQSFEGGFSGTGFLILTPDFRVQKILQLKLEDAADTRLIYWQGKIMATYNKFVGFEEVSHNRMLTIGQDREQFGLLNDDIECCTLIHTVLLQLTQADELFQASEEILLCSNLSAVLEKNWSPWVNRGDLRISYHIVPKHIVFIPDQDLTQCRVTFEKDISIFQQITEYFHNAIVFSLSTPAIPWEDYYLAMGHVKILKTTTQIHQRIHDLKYKPHPGGSVRYFMFFYTFNPRTLEINQITNSFIPSESKTNVVFPTGLIQNNNGEVIVSYGDSDNQMKLMILNRNDVNKLLNENPGPWEYQFRVL